MRSGLPPWVCTLVLATMLPLSGTGCGGGIASGIDYPYVGDVDLDKFLLTPEGESDPSVALNHFKIAPKTCEGFDLSMVTQKIDQEDLTRFFDTQHVRTSERKARGDLFWYEFANGQSGADSNLKLRLAILRDNNAAAKDLHDSLLQHGPGWWGVRRGNLALLAPRTSLHEALQFAIKTKLVCWGQFTYAGYDDVYTTVGGYTEF